MSRSSLSHNSSGESNVLLIKSQENYLAINALIFRDKPVSPNFAKFFPIRQIGLFNVLAGIRIWPASCGLQDFGADSGLSLVIWCESTANVS